MQSKKKKSTAVGFKSTNNILGPVPSAYTPLFSVSTGMSNTAIGHKAFGSSNPDFKKFQFKKKKDALLFAADLCDFTKDFNIAIHLAHDHIEVEMLKETFEELCNDEKFRELIVIHCTE